MESLSTQPPHNAFIPLEALCESTSAPKLPSAVRQRRFWTDQGPERVFQDGMCLHHIANTAYPIAHRKTIWQHRVAEERHHELLLREFANTKPFSLYAHIPFCRRRCKFCEYTVIADPDQRQEDQYHLALLKELRLYLDGFKLRGKPLAGFDIGGGTPALIKPEKIGELVAVVKDSFSLETGFGISIETTPQIAALHPDRLQSYRSFGIDRISMGLQMVNTELLRRYERDSQEIGFNNAAVRSIRAAGYREFNIDLMYGFAQQTVEDVLTTVRATIKLAPDVITLYRMRYKGTRVENEAALVHYDRVQEMYQMAHWELNTSGYEANPGKNTFCRAGHSPGTSPYLTQRVVNGMPYLGIGLGAQSFTNRLLAYNLGAASKKLDGYLQSVAAGRLPIQDLYDLPAREGMAKMLSVSFYFGEIDLTAFERCFGIPLSGAFPSEVDFLLKHELMFFNGQKLRLTDKGMRHFPGVVALFYSDAVKDYLHEQAALC